MKIIRDLFHGWDIPLEIYSVWVYAWTAMTNQLTFGTNIYEEDWDCAIILDACRVDALQQVATEYEFIEVVESRVSVGSTSKEWIFRTFVNDYLDEVNETTYITDNTFSRDIEANPDGIFNYVEIKETVLGRRREHANKLFETKVVDIDDFGGYDPVWKYMSDNNPYGSTSLPSDITDKAIHIGRNEDPDRMVIHYMQPHDPFLARAIDTGVIEEFERRPFDEMRAGNVNREELWDSYLDNLRLVLDEVERLLSNLDAEKVVITADHGELFGDVLHSHGPGILHPDLRKVPWVETSAQDTDNCSPDPIIRDSEDETDAEQRLKDLGYL